LSLCSYPTFTILPDITIEGNQGIFERPDVLPYLTDGTLQSQSIKTTDNEETTTLSQETMLKIQELRRLVYRYARYYRNPDAIIKCATYWSINGDNMILDELLEKLRMIASDD